MGASVRHRRHFVGQGRAALLLAMSLCLAATVAHADAGSDAAGIEAALAANQPVVAETLARDSLAASPDAAPLETANLHRLLGDALFYQERFAEAEPHYRIAFDVREKQSLVTRLSTTCDFGE